jgi:ubiquinone/menaquinone biosynthesis C-methylase UbiE
MVLPGGASDPNRVSSLITAFHGSATLFAGVELGVFAELSNLRKASAGVLAQTLQLNIRCTTLLLDACVALGLLEKEGSSYRNSVDAEAYLVPGGPLDLSGTIRTWREVYPLGMSIPSVVRTGMPVESAAASEKDPDWLGTQLLAQYSRTRAIGRPIIRRLNLENRTKLLEVGGGAGAYSMLISLEYPRMHCTVMDRPEVIKIAAGILAQQGHLLHVSTLGADYLTTPFPPGNDVVLMFGALHREPADQIPVLIRRAAESLNPGGLLYVMDIMTNETRTMPSTAALFALKMALTHQNGRIFSHVDLQHWMTQAGLQDFSVEVLPPPVAQWLARGRKRS